MSETAFLLFLFPVEFTVVDGTGGFLVVIEGAQSWKASADGGITGVPDELTVLVDELGGNEVMLGHGLLVVPHVVQQHVNGVHVELNGGEERTDGFTGPLGESVLEDNIVHVGGQRAGQVGQHKLVVFFLAHHLVVTVGLVGGFQVPLADGLSRRAAVETERSTVLLLSTDAGSQVEENMTRLHTTIDTGELRASELTGNVGLPQVDLVLLKAGVGFNGASDELVVTDDLDVLLIGADVLVGAADSFQQELGDNLGVAVGAEVADEFLQHFLFGLLDVLEHFFGGVLLIEEVAQLVHRDRGWLFGMELQGGNHLLGRGFSWVQMDLESVFTNQPAFDIAALLEMAANFVAETSQGAVKFSVEFLVELVVLLDVQGAVFAFDVDAGFLGPSANQSGRMRRDLEKLVGMLLIMREFKFNLQALLFVVETVDL